MRSLRESFVFVCFLRRPQGWLRVSIGGSGMRIARGSRCNILLRRTSKEGACGFLNMSILSNRLVISCLVILDLDFLGVVGGINAV